MTSETTEHENSAAVADPSFPELPDLHPTMMLPESGIAKLSASDRQESDDTHQLSAEPTGTIEPIPGYEISAAIGRGAMGVVYRARHIKLQRLVALKVLVGRQHASPADIARFNSEAVTIAQIQHPNVMQIYDVGEHNGFAYLAAEYIDGGTLETRMAAGPLSVPETIRLLYQISRGVGAAHSKGVVHRDLKPSNILLTSDGAPKVADFGLAKQLGPENATMTGAVMGTPAYMAPEQAAGQSRRIGPQTDVYSLGVILYQCLTGEVPLKGDSLLETLEQIRDVEPPSVREKRADTPEELEAVIERCLRKVPGERYPSADALAEDLEKIASHWETIRGNIPVPARKTRPAKPKPRRAVDPEYDEPREFNYRIPIIVASIGLALIVALFLSQKFQWFKKASPGEVRFITSPTGPSAGGAMPTGSLDIGHP